MLIDWQTVGAQIVNFLILVWLLKRFLYKPILAAMDAREKQIDANLRQAAEQKSLAEQERANYVQQCEDLERIRAEKLKRAEAEAADTRQKLLGDARAEAAALRAKWVAALKSEQDVLHSALERSIAREAYATIRGLLSDLADIGLEERMADTFIRRLHALDAGEKVRIAKALSGPGQTPVVNSAFELPQPTRARLHQAMRAELGIEAEPEFQVRPDLIAGIELTADGSKIAWSFAEALDGLEKSLDETLETEQVAYVHG